MGNKKWLLFLALIAITTDAIPAIGQENIRLTGKVLDLNTRQPVPYANIGLFEKNLGTLSDEDGSFELIIPSRYRNDTVLFSSIGYKRHGVAVNILLAQSGANDILLTPEIIMLKDVTVTYKKSKKQRLGWMGGKDGVLPLDTLQGGGAVALLVESPGTASYVEKLQVRLMYNSKDTLQFRLHFYAYDAARDAPGAELLQKEIILKETSRFGWLRYNLEEHDIRIYEKKFFVGFEWIDDRKTRTQMMAGLKDWNRWKKEQYEAGNKKVEKQPGQYKYHGNMMDWPGFKSLPPFTGLMIETGKTDKTRNLRTFERKTSFGKWNEIASTLNAVVTVSY
jgi:hypothetical protein